MLRITKGQIRAGDLALHSTVFTDTTTIAVTVKEKKSNSQWKLHLFFHPLRFHKLFCLQKLPFYTISNSPVLPPEI